MIKTISLFRRLCERGLTSSSSRSTERTVKPSDLTFFDCVQMVSRLNMTRLKVPFRGRTTDDITLHGGNYITTFAKGISISLFMFDFGQHLCRPPLRTQPQRKIYTTLIAGSGCRAVKAAKPFQTRGQIRSAAYQSQSLRRPRSNLSCGHPEIRLWPNGFRLWTKFFLMWTAMYVGVNIR